MKTKLVIGQRIVRVKQGMTSLGDIRGTANLVEYIELENGVRLYPLTHEMHEGYGTDFAINETAKKRAIGGQRISRTRALRGLGNPASWASQKLKLDAEFSKRRDA